jgi:hypothetical protein
MLWVRISIRARRTFACQWLATCRWLSPGSPVSSTNKTDRHDITEILLNTIKQTNKTKYILYEPPTNQMGIMTNRTFLLSRNSRWHHNTEAKTVNTCNNINNTNLTKKVRARVRTKVSWKAKQLLLHWWHHRTKTLYLFNNLFKQLHILVNLANNKYIAPPICVKVCQIRLGSINSQALFI